MCRLIERCRSKKCCTLWPHKFLRQVVWTAVVPAVGWHSFFQNAGSKWSTTSQTEGKIPSRTFCKQNLNWMTNCWRGFLLFVCLSDSLTLTSSRRNLFAYHSGFLHSFFILAVILFFPLLWLACILVARNHACVRSCGGRWLRCRGVLLRWLSFWRWICLSQSPRLHLVLWHTCYLRSGLLLYTKTPHLQG